MIISQEQKDFFETFGFIKFPQLMADSMDWIIDEFTKAFPKDHPHDGSKRSIVVPFIDQTAKMSTLLDDPRIEAIGSAFIGDDFNYTSSDGNYYTGNTSWHRDGKHKKYKYIKIAFYLDKIDGSSGALRVIPGSHRLDDQYSQQLDEKAARSEQYWNIKGDQIPATVLDIVPGDLVVFNLNTFHASYGGSTHRRMFTICMGQRHEEQDLQMLRDFIAGNAKVKNDLYDARNYTATMMNTASPQRLKHLEQIMANDGHLAAVCEELRRTMQKPGRIQL